MQLISQRLRCCGWMRSNWVKEKENVGLDIRQAKAGRLGVYNKRSGSKSNGRRRRL